MNDEELLENIVVKLISLDPGKWAKKYVKEENWDIKRTYFTIIGDNDIYLSSVIYLDSPIINLFLGKENYMLDILGRKIIKHYGRRRRQYRTKISELYRAIEEKVGKITEEDDKTTEENKELFANIQMPKKLRVIK